MSLTRPRSATVLVAEAVARLKAKDHAGTNASDYLICLLFRGLTCFDIPDALDYSQITSTYGILRYWISPFLFIGIQIPKQETIHVITSRRGQNSEMAGAAATDKTATQHLGVSLCVAVCRSVL